MLIFHKIKQVAWFSVKWIKLKTENPQIISKSYCSPLLTLITIRSNSSCKSGLTPQTVCINANSEITQRWTTEGQASEAWPIHTLGNHVLEFWLANYRLRKRFYFYLVCSSVELKVFLHVLEKLGADTTVIWQRKKGRQERSWACLRDNGWVGEDAGRRFH